VVHGPVLELALQIGGRSVQSHILFQGVVAAETASIGRSAADMCLGISRLQQALHCQANQTGKNATVIKTLCCRLNTV